MTSHHLETEVFAAYLDRTRWFGGKGRPYAVTDVRTLGELPGGPPLVVIHLVELSYSDGAGGTELYQVPLSFYVHPEDRLDHAFVGWWEDTDHGWVHAYDALHDREAMALWQRAFDAATGDGRTPVPPVAGPRARPGGALDAVHRRAVQLLGGLRRGRADEGVPQDHAGRQPRHRRCTRC